VYHFYDTRRKLKFFISILITFLIFQIYTCTKQGELIYNSILYSSITFVSVYSIYSLTKFAIDEWLSSGSEKIKEYEERIKKLEFSAREITKCFNEAVEIVKELIDEQR
jgi:hypothetical protein